jgi:hypothetical protein
MKVIADFFADNKSYFEVLSEEAMSEVRGGGVPKTRDKDIYEFEED